MVRRLTLLYLVVASLLGAQAPVVDERLAYTHLFLILAQSPDEDAAAFERRSVSYATERLGLSRNNARAFLEAAGNYNNYMVDLRKRAQSLVGAAAEQQGPLSPVDRAALMPLLEEMAEAIDGYINRLQSALDDDGRSILHAFVHDQVIPRINLRQGQGGK